MQDTKTHENRALALKRPIRDSREAEKRVPKNKNICIYIEVSPAV